MAGQAIPQTRTVMEAGFILREGIESVPRIVRPGPGGGFVQPCNEDRRRAR